MNQVKIKKSVYTIKESGIMENGKRFFILLKGKTEKTLCAGTSSYSLWGKDAANRTTMTVHSLNSINFI